MPEQEKPTFEFLYRKAVARHNLSQNKFARAADVSVDTVKAARERQPLQELSVIKLTNVLNKLLGTEYEYEQIDGLTVFKRDGSSGK